MGKRLSIWVLALVGCGASVSHADATLIYELSGEAADKEVKQFSISRFFVRIDSPGEEGRYLLFQAGKFFPVYSVDETERTYTQLTPAVTPRLGPVSRSAQVAAPEPRKDEKPAGGDPTDEGAGQAAAETRAGSVEDAETGTGTASAEPAAHSGSDAPTSSTPKSEPPGSEPASGAAASARLRSPAPALKPSREVKTVAGVRCRVVHELLDGEPVMEHCMANSAGLGVTKREVISLSRLFRMARDRGLGWLGTGTEDEEFVSVQTRDLRDDRMLQLTSVSTKALPAGYLRIPRTFERVEPDAQPGSDVQGVSLPADSPPE